MMMMVPVLTLKMMVPHVHLAVDVPGVNVVMVDKHRGDCRFVLRCTPAQIFKFLGIDAYTVFGDYWFRLRCPEDHFFFILFYYMFFF